MSDPSSAVPVQVADTGLTLSTARVRLRLSKTKNVYKGAIRATNTRSDGAAIEFSLRLPTVQPDQQRMVAAQNSRGTLSAPIVQDGQTPSDQDTSAQQSTDNKATSGCTIVFEVQVPLMLMAELELNVKVRVLDSATGHVVWHRQPITLVKPTAADKPSNVTHVTSSQIDRLFVPVFEAKEECSGQSTERTIIAADSDLSHEFGGQQQVAENNDHAYPLSTNDNVTDGDILQAASAVFKRMALTQVGDTAAASDGLSQSHKTMPSLNLAELVVAELDSMRRHVTVRSKHTNPTNHAQMHDRPPPIVHGRPRSQPHAHTPTSLSESSVRHGHSQSGQGQGSVSVVSTTVTLSHTSVHV